jgi:c-di-GMP-related signal transduction protein
MDVFLATQPIFKKNLSIFAYEVLFRNSTANIYPDIDEDKATSSVIIDCFQTIGLDNITSGKPAFINFTGYLLENEVATLFQPQKLVIELLETVVPTREIIKRCRFLKSLGYLLVLDDFVIRPEMNGLLQLADIIKVDFSNTSWQEINNITVYVKKKNKTARLLAEKVESYEVFERAVNLGYSLFQGYFFSRPVIVSSEDIPPNKINCLNLLNKVNDEEIDYDELALIINRDISLSYKLLKLANCPLFGLKREIKTINEALVLIGEIDLRKWLTLIILKGMGDGKPDEVIRRSLIRARLAERISLLSKFKAFSSELFLSGLFSMLDVLVGRPLEELLSGLPISKDVKELLTKKTSKYKDVFFLVLSLERAEWEKAVYYEKVLGVAHNDVMNEYVNSLIWYNTVISY